MTIDAGADRTMTLEELIDGVEGCKLPPGVFVHREHVRLAFHYLQQEPLLPATKRFAENIRRFAEHQGAYDKYDELVTVAYMVLIEARRRADPDADWEAFAESNADLIEDGLAVLRGWGVVPESSPRDR